MCFFKLAFLLEVQEHLVHSKKYPSSSSSSCCLLKWRPRLLLVVKHFLLISQPTSSHFSWHTRPGAYGGCSSCWTIRHNGHNMQTGAMAVLHVSPLILFSVKYIASQAACGSSPMLVYYMSCKSHLGLVALFTLSAREGFPLLGHLPTLNNPPPPPSPKAWTLKCQNKVQFSFILADLFRLSKSFSAWSS